MANIGEKYRGGHIPFGFSLSAKGTIKKDSFEQKVIRKTVALRNKGVTFPKIADELFEKFDVDMTPDQVRKNVLRTVSA